MTIGTYRLTKTAADHLRQIAKTTQARWGNDQVRKYLNELKHGFQHVADHHEKLSAKKLFADVSDIRLHRVGVHYIAYVVLASQEVAIVAILHEKMDVPTRLRALRSWSQGE